MKIGIVQRDDTRSILSSSGTIYSMGKALERHVGEVVHLGPSATLRSKVLIKAGQVVNKLSEPLLKRRLSPIHQRTLATHAAEIFSKRIQRSGCDVLYAPFASVEIAALDTPLPILYHTDMTWDQGVDYYPIYSGLFDFAREQGEAIQRSALEKAAVTIFPSQWAARSATEHYGIDPKKVSVVPYGANFSFEELPSAAEALSHNLSRGVNLLWIGVDWERKGGQAACDCLDALVAKGVDARLTICGCTPPTAYNSERISVVPFLNKHKLEELHALSQLYLNANFFLFPTFGEAAAIVLCEASAHGLPSIVRNTGGLASVVTDGVNGYLLPETAMGQEFAEKIFEILNDGDRYSRLVRGSRQAYEERLNWDAWGRAVQPLFERSVLSANAA